LPINTSKPTMNYQTLYQIIIRITISVVLIQALIWLSWLYRFYSRPPTYVAPIIVGSISLAVGTGVIEMFLAFGLRNAFAKTPAFWFGIGYSVSVFLSATSMVCSQLLIVKFAAADQRYFRS
jgi:hypothetical protein